MHIAFRLLRVVVAAAMLHLTMASPARACEQMERATAPMTHAGHHMPAPDVPARKHSQQPCCPTMPAGCMSSACSVVAVETLVMATAPAVRTMVAPHTAFVVRWQSVSNAPEPPPPRA